MGEGVVGSGESPREEGVSAPGIPAGVVLKVDVDTFRGTREGVPGILEELERAGVKASFFFTLGADRSGRAIFRVFRKKGFLSKMARTNPLKMYGLRTLLYGTLLPAPRIGKRLSGLIRSVREAGHETGLHAWDHVKWQDSLERMSPGEIEKEIRLGVEAYGEIFGERPRLFAAPAWLATDPALEALEKAGFSAVSLSRGRVGPFRLAVGGRPLEMVEVPTTLPTLDECLGREGVTRENWNEKLLSLYRPGEVEVLTIHAETEGLAYRAELRDLLERHRRLGIPHLTLGEAARRIPAEDLPVRPLSLGTVPGRAGRVAVPGKEA